ncbi:MAG: NAD-binding protein, partial [Acidobacteria bacterium]|nr:NAD-binding protein [Acidobacteriota bacterium]
VGRSLAEIAAEFEPEWVFMIGAITRGDNTFIPRSDHRLEQGDLLRLAVNRRSRGLVADLMGFSRETPRRIMLLGGGRTAEVVADRLAARGAHVVLVERNPDRARELAEQLDGVMVLEGEITDSDLLEEADIGSFDVVVALTGEDDANILACLFAKKVAKKADRDVETIAVVHRLAFLDLLRQADIDATLSPRTASANGVLRFVHGDIAAVATFLQGDCEVLELPVKPGSPADGAVVQELGLPKGVLIGAIVRDGKSRIARGHSELRGRDQLVVFSMADAVDDVHEFFG